MSKSPSVRPSKSVSSDDRGSAAVEYVSLLFVLGLVTAVAVAALGPVLLNLFARASGLLLLPT